MTRRQGFIVVGRFFFPADPLNIEEFSERAEAVRLAKEGDLSKLTDGETLSIKVKFGATDIRPGSRPVARRAAAKSLRSSTSDIKRSA